ncbi:hypothetical protein W97_06894 [Coniosporium apollinis CBS 100218]|uniref:type I protein arginine methyltransferase n=1 Tax=Coniosporium apollinis (strain CBS 100218) TaxID=1168221 RepID=R7Z0S8_CONA1|nr:uncharacterized protein W97_06894 [Coniosporium apollinis CBS 100218]EON67526.1 hypothetical protein W97_06894 [Coniosporium apollinis CBS 100218]
MASHAEPSFRDASPPPSSSSSSADLLDTRDDEGWEDANPDDDTENIQVKSFFDDTYFTDVRFMINACKIRYNFDFLAVLRSFDLDFYGRIKLVNYIRAEVQAGNTKPDLSSKSLFEDDKYLQPVLEDDALLFCLDDLIDELEGPPQTSVIGGRGKALFASEQNPLVRISELESQLERMRIQFAEYRETVSKTLEQRWEDSPTAPTSATAGPSTTSSNGTANRATKRTEAEDASYFQSYSYNEIHETMLKDTIRTDAYRDFIYEHKHLFQDKVVLDVGCGTGILSMFCAKAGAKKVIAVDNSAIIDKCRANVFTNGFGDVITCLKGKIEEVVLPVEKVDVIVSEWMGYCLLYEAMLASVLYARDKYLRQGGLMVPSHCTLRIAPIVDQAYIADSVDFWTDVYGFDMKAMSEGMLEDVLVRQLKAENLAADAVTFKTLNLHEIKTDELDFTSEFELVAARHEDEELDGWCIWFDTFFLLSSSSALPADAVAETWKGEGNAFTTGPGGKQTHWQSGVLMIDKAKNGGTFLKKGVRLEGRVTYQQDEGYSRGLKIAAEWAEEGGKSRKGQSWLLS